MSDNSIYRWVKASERLPIENFALNLRIDGADIGTGHLYGQPQNKYFCYRFWSSEYHEDVTYDRVEWLEKVEADQQELWDEVSDKFQTWIDNDFDERAASEVAEQELKPKYHLMPK